MAAVDDKDQEHEEEEEDEDEEEYNNDKGRFSCRRRKVRCVPLLKKEKKDEEILSSC